MASREVRAREVLGVRDKLLYTFLGMAIQGFCSSVLSYLGIIQLSWSQQAATSILFLIVSAATALATRNARRWRS